MANASEAAGTHAVYMLRCGDGTLYTGMARDPQKRLLLHREGKAARYTRGRGPLELVYVEWHADLSGALRRERSIKQLSRRGKWNLVGAPPAGG